MNIAIQPSLAIGKVYNLHKHHFLHQEKIGGGGSTVLCYFYHGTKTNFHLYQADQIKHWKRT